MGRSLICIFDKISYLIYHRSDENSEVNSVGEEKYHIYLSTKARNEIVACLFLSYVINLSSLDNGFFRTNIKAIPTVQATVLNNSCVSACKINTSLRTDYNTFLTTDTLICYIIAVNCFYTVSKWKRFSINRFFWKVKPFSASVINSKHVRAVLDSFVG